MLLIGNTPPVKNGFRRSVTMRYCFQAISPLFSKPRGFRPKNIGVAIAFGRDPYVAKDVGKVVKDLKKSGQIDKFGEVSLTCFEYCPVELSDEVFVHIFGRESQKVPMAYTGDKKFD